MDDYDMPLSFQGELYHIDCDNDHKVYVSLDTKSQTFRHFNSRTDYMEDLPPVYQLALSNIYSIRKLQRDKLIFSIRLKEKNLLYYCEFMDMTLEWISKIQQSLEYYHISNQDRENKGSKRLEEEMRSASDLSEISEDTTGDTIINEESFENIEEIGSGGFGTVWKVIKKDTGEVFAMKRLNKNSLRNNRMIKYAWSECKTLNNIKHPFIIDLKWRFQTTNYIIMVMDYCTFGDFEPILDHFKKLDEETAKFYIAETILAVEYLHSKNIVYRDLKPSNLMLDKDGHIKLADFGLAKENVTIENPAISFCGTPAYLPPEILSNSGCYIPTDIYLLGVNLFRFLAGKIPFYDKSLNLPDLYRAISNSKLVFPSEISAVARDLISLMMNKRPEQRPTVKQVKEHKFFEGVNWELIYEKRIAPPISVEELNNIIKGNCEIDPYIPI